MLLRRRTGWPAWDWPRPFEELERFCGSFRRTFSLPCEIDADKVDASFKDGVLHITLPKTETSKGRIKKIAVKSA